MQHKIKWTISQYCVWNSETKHKFKIWCGFNLIMHMSWAWGFSGFPICVGSKTDIDF